MKTTNILLSVIGVLVAALITIIGYFSDKALSEVDNIKANQVKAMEAQITMMERMGVVRTEIDAAKQDIREINKQLDQSK